MPKTIALSRGLSTVVDDADYEWLSRWKWAANQTKKGCFYAARWARPAPGAKKKIVYMHRSILGLEGRGAMGDHIDGDPLNNCRSNLRVVDPRHNCINHALRRDNSSGYAGVYRTAWGTYYAMVYVYGERIYLGTRKTLAEAVALRHRAELDYYGAEYLRCAPMPEEAAG